MKTIHLRDDPGEPHGIPDLCLLVTNYEEGDYEEGDYEGGGTSYGLSTDRLTVYEFDHSHCSCYGPWDGDWSGEPVHTVPLFFDTFVEWVCDDTINVGKLADLETAKRFLQEARS